MKFRLLDCTQRGVMTLVLAALCFTLSFGVLAEEPVPTNVSTEEAADFLGPWKLALSLMGRELELYLKFVDVEGQLGATLDSEFSPEPMAISEIEHTENGLDLNSEMAFGGGNFRLNINITAAREGEDIVGIVKDKGGFFSAEYTGVRVSQEELDAVQGRRPDPTEARLNVDGKRVRIAFAELEMDSSDWELFQQMKPGDVHRYTLSRATKMYTDLDLKFGDAIVKQGNMDPEYPGVYSLWLKRTEDGWSLLFNELPDTWGTRHDPKLDVAEVPLKVSKVEGEPVEEFKIELERVNGKGKMLLYWGDMQWSTDFEYVQ